MFIFNEKEWNLDKSVAQLWLMLLLMIKSQTSEPHSFMKSFAESLYCLPSPHNILHNIVDPSESPQNV